MPESMTRIRERAKSLNYPTSQITKNPNGSGYYLAPRGMRTKAGKTTYAKNRSEGKSQASSARIAWKSEKRARKK